MEYGDIEWAKKMSAEADKEILKDSDSPFYLDYLYRSVHEGGEKLDNIDYDSKVRLVNREIKKQRRCKRTVLELYSKKINKFIYIPIFCNKWWCYKCSGYNGRIHKARIDSVSNRLILKEIAIRQFVFTIPYELREHFTNRQALQAFFNIVHRLIDRYFGIDVSNGKAKKKSRLDKGVIAYLHLFGGDKSFDPDLFNPHVNVHIIEKRSAFVNKKKLRIPKKILHAIKHSYRKALKSYIISTPSLREKKICRVSA